MMNQLRLFLQSLNPVQFITLMIVLVLAYRILFQNNSNGVLKDGIVHSDSLKLSLAKVDAKLNVLYRQQQDISVAVASMQQNTNNAIVRNTKVYVQYRALPTEFKSKTDSVLFELKKYMK